MEDEEPEDSEVLEEEVVETAEFLEPEDSEIFEIED